MQEQTQNQKLKAATQSEAESTANVIQSFTAVTFDNDVAQTSTTTQINALTDDDTVAVTQTNVPVQTQEDAIAADIDFEGDVEALETLELLGLGGDNGCCTLCGG